jgi:hypothetical protein
VLNSLCILKFSKFFVDLIGFLNESTRLVFWILRNMGLVEMFHLGAKFYLAFG